MSDEHLGSARKTWRVKVRNVTGGETLYIHATAISASAAVQLAVSTAQSRWRSNGIRTANVRTQIVDEMGRPREDVEREMERDAFVAEEGTRS